MAVEHPVGPGEDGITTAVGGLGLATVTLLSRRDPLDDVPLRAFQPLQLETGSSQVVERVAQQVVGLEAYGQGVQ